MHFLAPRAKLPDCDAISFPCSRHTGGQRPKGGKAEKTDEWGKKQLAYEIKKATEAYYTFITFEAPETAPAAIESDIRIMEQVLRFLIVKQEA